MTADRTRTGRIFNIQKFSINDGPGIRTRVFFKGCPLRCKWCSNPESQLTRIQILWDRSKCLNCHHCISICPADAIRCEDNNTIRISHDKCTGCKLCAQQCPGKALTTEGEVRSIDDILQTVLQDRDFYEESGGGITLSGGEIMLQPDFARELLKAAKEEKLDTCIETTGFTSEKIFLSVIEYVDHILFDMKHYDSDKHLNGTGVGNQLITENMKKAVILGKDILPRIPVIPGFNDSTEDAAGLADHLLKIGIKRCQLLPFHQFGENKYHLLGMTYQFEGVDALHKEELDDYINVFTDKGVSAFF